jgi:hypothetical protein
MVINIFHFPLIKFFVLGGWRGSSPLPPYISTGCTWVCITPSWQGFFISFWRVFLPVTLKCQSDFAPESYPNLAPAGGSKSYPEHAAGDYPQVVLAASASN